LSSESVLHQLQSNLAARLKLSTANELLAGDMATEIHHQLKKSRHQSSINEVLYG